MFHWPRCTLAHKNKKKDEIIFFTEKFSWNGSDTVSEKNK